VSGRGRIAAAGSAIEPSKDSLVPPIGDLEEQHTVALGTIDRLQDEQVCGEVNLAVWSLLRVLQVDDRFVVTVRRVESELDRPDQLLVRTGIAERLPVGNDDP
jgi:hypothetical protein